MNLNLMIVFCSIKEDLHSFVIVFTKVKKKKKNSAVATWWTNNTLANQ